MIEWQDNSEYLLSDQVEHLRPLANRPLSSLLNERDDNLLVFPLSFQECEDRIGEQHLFDLEVRFRASKERIHCQDWQFGWFYRH